MRLFCWNEWEFWGNSDDVSQATFLEHITHLVSRYLNLYSVFVHIVLMSVHVMPCASVSISVFVCLPCRELDCFPRLSLAAPFGDSIFGGLTQAVTVFWACLLLSPSFSQPLAHLSEEKHKTFRFFSSCLKEKGFSIYVNRRIRHLDYYESTCNSTNDAYENIKSHLAPIDVTKNYELAAFICEMSLPICGCYESHSNSSASSLNIVIRCWTALRWSCEQTTSCIPLLWRIL